MKERTAQGRFAPGTRAITFLVTAHLLSACSGDVVTGERAGEPANPREQTTDPPAGANPATDPTASDPDPAASVVDPNDPQAGSSARKLHLLRTEWEEEMTKTPVPGKGCFEASYPSMDWEEVGCVHRDPVPYMPSRTPLVIGNGPDHAARVSGLLTSAAGSFTSITGVTWEKSGGVNDSYTLQINSQAFATTACNGAPNPKCMGWQQFVHVNTGIPGNDTGTVFMQYWMLEHGAPCPAGWVKFLFPNDIDPNAYCYRDSPHKAVGNQPIANLINLKLTGTAASGGIDQAVFSAGAGSPLSSPGSDSMLGLAGKWNYAEFNIFGGPGGANADFSPNSTLVVQVKVTDGTTSAPTCGQDSTTGETSALNLVPGSCCATPGTSPQIVFRETNVASPPAPPFCLLNDIVPILANIR